MGIRRFVAKALGLGDVLIDLEKLCPITHISRTERFFSRGIGSFSEITLKVEFKSDIPLCHPDKPQVIDKLNLRVLKYLEVVFQHFGKGNFQRISILRR